MYGKRHELTLAAKIDTEVSKISNTINIENLYKSAFLQ